MSKYIKLEGLKWHSPDESIVEALTEFYITESDIADLPTIEVSEDCISRAEGEWTKRETVASVDFAYCSECKQPIIHGHTSPLWNYCPNCGAKMR